MEKDEKLQKAKIGERGHLNENCWLVKSLNYSPANRCQYCELKFRNCLFFRYLIISLILVFSLLTLSLLIEKEIPKSVTISILVLVTVYGYFFNKSTERIIKASFAQKKAAEALEELTENLQERVDAQTKELKMAYEDLKKRKEEAEKLAERERFLKEYIGKIALEQKGLVETQEKMAKEKEQEIAELRKKIAKLEEKSEKKVE